MCLQAYCWLGTSTDSVSQSGACSWAESRTRASLCDTGPLLACTATLCPSARTAPCSCHSSATCKSHGVSNSRWCRKLVTKQFTFPGTNTFRIKATDCLLIGNITAFCGEFRLGREQMQAAPKQFGATVSCLIRMWVGCFWFLIEKLPRTKSKRER